MKTGMENGVVSYPMNTPMSRLQPIQVENKDMVNKMQKNYFTMTLQFKILINHAI